MFRKGAPQAAASALASMLVKRHGHIRFAPVASRCRQRLQALVRRWFLGLKRRSIERQSLNVLGTLSSDALQDIGLSRSDFPSVQTGMIFRDETRRKR